MKNKFLMGIVLILSLSLMFAHGENLGTVNENNESIISANFDLKIIELNEQMPVALAVDEKGIYYILRLDNMYMFYNDLPIVEGKEIKVKAVVLYSFSKIEELIVTSVEIDNKIYIIPENFAYGMMGGYGYPGMMNMMGGYGYPGMMNMMDGYGYPGMMNMMGGYGYSNMMNENEYENMMNYPKDYYQYKDQSKDENNDNEMNMENK
ncbi:hypothetical protein SAMN02745164_01685 [Marinitoga hydrogenitolerans DSM 16785]|uniref:Uncharacterized protein n=1 Tax=Marinitoga hydrogenitolerans (strain DSM 16785 / JCM 12826 / AT1271) TaxID=1122195 RepID=A0A1M4YIG2_MARH1|nr:hypothetical protein [Marinitoga hydrogenitolerans]SHF05491.1 hypothetical protein SAMN02745164_01685 [Marinitoga hydrogenitolerans DSM 16785]